MFHPSGQELKVLRQRVGYFVEGRLGDYMTQTKSVLQLNPSQVKLRVCLVENDAEYRFKSPVAQCQVRRHAPQCIQPLHICAPAHSFELSGLRACADGWIENSAQ